MKNFSQLSIFYLKVVFLKDRHLVEKNKAAKLLKQIFKKYSHAICQKKKKKDKLNYLNLYVSPFSRLVLSLKSFLTAIEQIFTYFFQSDEVGCETLTCQEI